jgi:translation elongation factor EF-G
MRAYLPVAESFGFSQALAEATSTIKSSYSFIDVNEAEELLQQKQFRQLISAIDRWNKVGDKFHKA